MHQLHKQNPPASLTANAGSCDESSESLAHEARRQSQLIAKLAADPESDEAEVMRWIENVSDDLSQEWKP